VVNGTVPDGDEAKAIKEKADEKVVGWMKVSFANKNVDMRFKSTEKDLICILIDII